MLIQFLRGETRATIERWHERKAALLSQLGSGLSQTEHLIRFVAPPVIDPCGQISCLSHER